MCENCGNNWDGGDVAIATIMIIVMLCVPVAVNLTRSSFRDGQENMFRYECSQKCVSESNAAADTNGVPAGWKCVCVHESAEQK